MSQEKAVVCVLVSAVVQPSPHARHVLLRLWVCQCGLAIVYLLRCCSLHWYACRCAVAFVDVLCVGAVFVFVGVNCPLWAFSLLDGTVGPICVPPL